MAADVMPYNKIDSDLKFSNRLDTFHANAYSADVKFDLNPPSYGSLKGQLADAEAGAADVEPSDDLRKSINNDINMKASPPKDWELDVRGLVGTAKWLQNYGLKHARLDMNQLLPQIGFKHLDDYDKTLKKPICSRYGSNLFQKYLRSDGKTFNVACTKDKLHQIEARLTQAICLYKRRLDWLTSESRRVFGVVEEKSVCIVLDIKNLSPQQFDQYLAGVERLVREQVTQLAKFNIVRASEDLNSYNSHCVPVSADSIDGAVEWLHALDRTAAVSPTATCEAVMKAVADHNVEAVYLYTEGSACAGARQILKEKLTGCRVPLHVVSYNCTDGDTIGFLKELGKITGGRFHAYAVTMEMDSYEGVPHNPNTNQANIILRKKTYGGVPPGAGMRDDVILLFEELEEARNNLSQIQAVIQEMPDKQTTAEPPADTSEGQERPETYMSSREWLDCHGIKAKKLGLYDILSSVAFKHQDGVVDIKTAPRNADLQTDAINKPKLVNAKYCDKFPFVRWKDGQVVHVQVSPEIHRNYEQRMGLAMEAIQQRIDWLQQGSRELFGTVIEDQIYILIDTSASMSPHLQFVKDKLFILMQEQLRHKQKFNLIAFNNKVQAWKDRLVEVNEKNLQGAWQWIKALTCSGSTNTMTALRTALADPSTQAIYMLTDGRPDQPPKSIIAQVMLHPQVPVHCISFNCSDKDANEFLCELSKDTCGRFHYYSENGVDPDGPEPWESEDIRLLRQEQEMGYRNLEKVALLRDECATLAWKKDVPSKRSSREAILADRSRDALITPRNSLSNIPDPYERPQSAPGFRFQPSPPPRTPRPSTAHGYRPGHNKHRPTFGTRPMSARSPRSRPMTGRLSIKPIVASCPSISKKANVAGHTRTSLLRTLSSSGQFGKPEWLLPETRDLLERQWQRQEKLTEGEMKKKKNKQARASEKMMSSKKWLSKHGLAARKLTILDALAPTFIPHRSKYVRILDKHVEAKVFDHVMPIGHLSADKKDMTIVNPQAVNMQTYISRVEEAVERYKRRLNRVVWEALTEKEKEEFGSDRPISFLDNKLVLMQALDRCGWPVSERDVVLLENEIRQGEVYVKQAQDLKEAGNKRGRGLRSHNRHRDADDDDRAASVTSSVASGKNLEDSGAPSHSKTTSKAKGTKLTKAKVKRALDALRGQKVIGRNEVDGFYYPGVVIRCPNVRHALIEFDEIGQQTVPSRFVIPISGAIPSPLMRIGDYVLSRVVNQDTGLECYVPGIIQMTPQREEAQAKFYTVIMYTGQQAHFLRSYLVKISKMRFTFLVRYIREVSRRNADNRHKGDRSTAEGNDGNDERNKSRPRSRSASSDRSRSGSRSSRSGSSRSRSRSRSRSTERTDNSGDSRASRQQKHRLERWQKLLEDQQNRQEREQKKLRKKAKKLAKLKKKLETDGSGEQQKLLEMILDEINKNQQAKSPKPVSGRSRARIDEWVMAQNGRPGETPGLEVNLDPDKDAILVSSGDKGVLISHTVPDTTPQFLLDLRHTLPPLRVGEEVLARWADEGWYYRGTMRQECGDGSFFIEDSVGDLEKIWREDIIADNDDADIVIQPRDSVVALHPSYSFSYAPGVVLVADSELAVQVRFYDGLESSMAREEIYRIPAEKFEVDVDYILKCEEQWVGQAVVARNDDNGCFQLGAVRDRVGNGRQYTLEWSDGQSCVQSSSLIFGAFTKRHPLAAGDRVLAISDPNTLTYLPGWITSINGDKLLVKFCDGSQSSRIEVDRCFWLSQDYYDMVVAFYKSKNKPGHQSN